MSQVKRQPKPGDVRHRKNCPTRESLCTYYQTRYNLLEVATIMLTAEGGRFKTRKSIRDHLRICERCRWVLDQDIPMLREIARYRKRKPPAWLPKVLRPKK